jgi:curved DNA-binding protein CbpA
MGGVPNAYAVLQVDPEADPLVVKAAYRALARLYHPDGDAPDVGRMAQLNRAYEVLRDPEARRRHDRALAVGRVPQPVPMRPAGPARVDPWRPPDPNDRGAGVLDFGRYMGWRITDLARHDPDYLRWLSRHSSGIRYRDVIARALPREPDLQRRSSSVA